MVGRDGNIEIVKVENGVIFEYRFIRFNFVHTRFEPVKFDMDLPFSQLRKQYALGLEDRAKE